MIVSFRDSEVNKNFPKIVVLANNVKLDAK